MINTFMMWWTGATSRSVNCSFLQRGSLLHHCTAMKQFNSILHALCTATAILFIYSFSGNSAASAPMSTFMCLWEIYIFPGSVHIFPPAEKADPSWEYSIRSQTHECGNWDWGPDIPFLGIFVSNFPHFVFAVWLDNHALTFKSNTENILLVKNPVFCKPSCWESRKFKSSSEKTLISNAISVFKKVNLNIWQTFHDPLVSWRYVQMFCECNWLL